MTKNIKNIIKISGTAILLSIAVFVLSGCKGKIENNVETSQISVEIDISLDTRIGYSALNSAKKELYEKVVNCVATRQTKMDITKEQAEFFWEIKNLVYRDYPEFFWRDNGQILATKSIFGESYKFETQYDITKEDQDAMQSEIDNVTNDFLSTVSDGLSDYEKAKLVYEYVIFNTKYEKNIDNDQNIYGALVNKKSVCGGYSQTVQYLLNKLDVKCMQVVGMAHSKTKSELHAWNMVLIDNDFYYMDATWGDTDFDPEDNISAIRYDYLCVTTNDLQATHEADNLVNLRKCTSKESNYYIVENAYINKYDYDLIKNIFKNQLSNSKIVTFRCSDIGVYTKVKKELLDDNKICDILIDLGMFDFENGLKLSYTLNDELGVITMYF